MTKVTKAALTERARQYGCASLLGTRNAKTVKGNDRGYLTGVLYMMPDDQLCPMSREAGCREACLVTAGRAAFQPGIGEARAGRTKFFHQDRWAFTRLLELEIRALKHKAEKQGLTLAIRLNGTSDIDWSSIELDFGETIFERFPDVIFYDYTKRPDIMRKSAGVSNWHITGSYSEASAKYKAMIWAAAEKYGCNLSVVFDSPDFPASFHGRRVIDGDANDLRFEDPASVIVGLKAKGDAKQDTTGFVIAAA